MSKPLQKKEGKICQCIIVAKTANMDDKIHERGGMLADLGLKSVTGHYHRDGTTMMVTALYKWEKRMRIHAVKKKFADYYAANFSTFSMQYPEYDGVLTCYGKDEKMEFLIQLNKIKETDYVDNTNCFFWHPLLLFHNRRMVVVVDTLNKKVGPTKGLRIYW